MRLRSAPGPGALHCEALRQLPLAARKELAAAFNGSIGDGGVPASWEVGIAIVPLLKPGKPGKCFPPRFGPSPSPAARASSWKELWHDAPAAQLKPKYFSLASWFSPCSLHVGSVSSPVCSDHFTVASGGRSVRC
ncbi:uncharacterized protein Tco025E_02808 [Trypanosoma conorhini]|uniref:Uncharacterized protein n=1 Tax=Trypanosoma conorhini TaxID=83891 RepID=A0A3R7NU32_9TRYP|nr:uncharacterized protein Tco025E_02808 [Trypanosoma conorhini]RNF23516.1 hypothetical protein Tco025E_02808 [Trypanosoma conorhini]